MLLGAAIGFEREIEDKPAGLRTHMMVAGAAALFTALGTLVVQRLEGALHSELVRSDPIRVIQAVVTGVSFLGAGTILRPNGRTRIEGLTTAASILLSSGVGMAVALSEFVLAIGVTLLALLTLRGVGFAQRREEGQQR